MKILAISKRQYTNKDLLDDQYGRVWELPFELAKRGHKIEGICLSYRKRKSCNYNNKISSSSFINWQSFNLVGGFSKYILYIHNLVSKFHPDIIWTTSDAMHIIWGVILGKIYGVPVVCDLYDNYEFFKITRVIGVKQLYRSMLKKSNGISCVSQSLKELVLHSYCYDKSLGVIGNGVNNHMFFPMPKKKCREYFKLPSDVALIGVAGALQENRGIDSLYQAFKLLVRENNHLHLALAGVGSRDHDVFYHPNVHDFGVLNYRDIPFFINMLDVAIVCNKDSEFGRFCFPQKAYEIMACETPIVAADIGVMSNLLQKYPKSLFSIGEYQDLSNKIDAQLAMPSRVTISVQTWSAQAKRLEALMSSVVL